MKSWVSFDRSLLTSFLHDSVIILIDLVLPLISYLLNVLFIVGKLVRHLYLPVYSGKHMVRGDFLIFSSNRSFLLRKRIMDVSVNHLLLQIESKSFKLSCIRF